MTPIRSALIWAAAFILLAIANRFDLVSDKDATAMFAFLPALWVMSSGVRGCRSRKVAA